MRNVTVSLDDQVFADMRVKAAKAGKSLSRYMADLVRSDVDSTFTLPPSRNEQMEALERILSGPKWSVMREGRMPNADERNER